MPNHRWFLLSACALLWGCDGDGCSGGTGPNCPQQVTLNIAVSPGVIASPSGAQHVESGTNINYSFQLAAGYEHLRVTLDSIEVAAAGTVEVRENQRLLGTADLILDPSQDASIISANQALLTAANPYEAYRTLETLTLQLIDQVGLQAAQRRLAIARVQAYDPARDAVALNRALAAVGESLYARNGAESRRVALAQRGIPTPLVYYVNGIRTQDEDYETTQELLRQLLTRHGLILDVDGFYNPTWNRQNPVADAVLCVAMQNDLVQASQWTKRFQAVGNVLQCLAIAPIEAIDFLDWLKSFSYTLRADRLPTLAIQDLTNRINEIIPTRPLVLVMHSGGNLLAQVALTKVAAGPHSDRLSCVGVVGIAPPTTEGWPVQPTSVVQGVMKGERVKDVMLMLDLLPNFSHSFVPDPPGLNPWENALSKELDHDAEIYEFNDWDYFKAALQLHAIDTDYLTYADTEQLIAAAIADQATRVISNCGGGGGPLTITTPSLPSGVVGTSYGAQLGASGGIGGYTWSVVGGALPSGLTMSSSGAVTGVPTERETASFTVQVASGPETATHTFSLTIGPASLIFEPASVAFAGTVNGSDPTNQNVTVTSSSSSTVNGLSVTGISYDGVGGWLTATLTPASLTTPATLELNAHLGSLGQGTYAATVTVGSSQYEGTLPVSFQVQTVGGTDVSGKWLYLVAFESTDAENRVDCIISTGSTPGEGPGPSEDVDLVLTQTGGTLQGTHPAMSYLCLSLSSFDQWSGTLPPGSVTGTVTGTAMAFDLSSSAWHNTATYVSDPFAPSITGALTVLLNLSGIGQVSVEGDWTVFCDYLVASACNPDLSGRVSGAGLR